MKRKLVILSLVCIFALLILTACTQYAKPLEQANESKEITANATVKTNITQNKTSTATNTTKTIDSIKITPVPTKPRYIFSKRQ